MKVLFVSGEFPPMQGGVGDYTREIGLALFDLGCEVEIVTSAEAGPVPGLTVHALIERWNWSSWRMLLDLIRLRQPDVVHIQYQAAAYAMHPAVNFLPWRLRRLGAARPCSAVTFHDLRVPYLFPKAGWLRQWVIDQLARRSDVAICTNREDFEALRQRLAVSPALIPIGSNIAPRLPVDYDRDAWRARWGVGPDGLVLCFFGFINERKGVDTLVKALSLLVSQSRDLLDPYLLMIGGQTGASDPTNVASLARIRALIAELGLEERIRWTGYVTVEEVSASFDAADLCVLPFRDGASFLHGTFHAALAHGVPIVTTQPRVTLPELLDRENVLLIPPNQPQVLAEAVLQLASAPEWRRALGAGAKALSEQFRWDKIAAETLNLYGRLAVSTVLL